MKTSRTGLAPSLACTLAASCQLAQEPDFGRPHVEVLPLEAGAEPGVTEEVLSRELQLVADNQFRYTGGEGTVLTMALVDAFVPTANRPAELNTFSNLLLAWCLEKGGDRPIVHLGDACDMSCVIEFTFFAEVMREAARPWAMVPGNHDCAFLGSAFDLVWEEDTWARACDGGGGPMQKSDFVALYLAALWDQLGAGPHGDELARALGSTTEELRRDLPEPGSNSQRYPELALRIRTRAPQGSWSCSDPDAFITGISWVIDEEHTWRSYVAQRISMTDPTHEAGGGFTGVLLDTCQWWHKPQLVPINVVPAYEHNPGLVGELLADQLTAVKAWMDEAARDGDAIALFAHHPVKEFAPKSRQALAHLWRNYDVVMLASGHTHAGYVDVHDDLEPGALEINVASVTDWPMEWRHLRLSRYRRGDQAYYGVRSPRFKVLDVVRGDGAHVAETWEDFESGAERFLRYRVLDDMALDYETGIGDIMAGHWGTIALSPLIYLLLGEDTTVRTLVQRVIPNLEGIEREHLARRRLMLEEVARVFDRFPTVGHDVFDDWPQRETEFLDLLERAVRPGSTKEMLDEAIWAAMHYGEGRQVADPEAERRYVIMLCVWASMYHANREGNPVVTDESFRVFRAADESPR